MKFLQSAEWARRLTPCSCSRRSPSLRPWEGRETFNRCSLSGLLPLRVEAPDLLVVMKFSLMFMAFMAFSSSVMSMVRFFYEFDWMILKTSILWKSIWVYLKYQIKFWKFNRNLKSFYSVWKFISNMRSGAMCVYSSLSCGKVEYMHIASMFKTDF